MILNYLFLRDQTLCWYVDRDNIYFFYLIRLMSPSFLIKILNYTYEGGLKSFRPSLQPTRNSGQAAVG